MSSKFAILRHGITNWNLEGKIQGRTDVPLSKAGRISLSSVSVPSLFHDVEWITSPLQRAKETAHNERKKERQENNTKQNKHNMKGYSKKSSVVPTMARSE